MCELNELDLDHVVAFIPTCSKPQSSTSSVYRNEWSSRRKGQTPQGTQLILSKHSATTWLTGVALGPQEGKEGG